MKISRRTLIGAGAGCMATGTPAFSLAAPNASGPLQAQLATALATAIPPGGPGAVARIQRGAMVVEAAAGLADVELQLPLATDHVFRIASITKTFVAALVLRLAEQGRLSLDDPANRYIEAAPWPDVTIRRLLSHTAGISAKPAVPQPGFSRRDWTIDAIVADIVQRPLDFTPGSQQSYSNPGYMLLGAIVEKITGEPWYKALHRELLAPLGLARTQHDDSTTLARGRVSGYSVTDSGVANASFVSMTTVASAGALLSTASDLTRWMEALATGRLLRSDSFAAMTKPASVSGNVPADPYGLGIYIWRIRGEIAFGHTGQINGFATALAYLPRTGHALAVLANADTFDARTFLRRMAAMAIDKPYPPVRSVSVPQTLLDRLPGAYGADGQTAWTILREGTRLYAQRPGRNRIALQMSSEGMLHFDPDALTFFRPVASGGEMRIEYVRDGEAPGAVLSRTTG